MLRCDYLWTLPRRHVSFSEHDYGEILSQAPSQLIQILQACTITRWNNNTVHIGISSLASIHFLLDFSWDKLRKSICPLRKIMGKYNGKLDELFLYASNPSLCPRPASIFRDLSHGYLRVMRSFLSHKLSWNFRQVSFHATNIKF